VVRRAAASAAEAAGAVNVPTLPTARRLPPGMPKSTPTAPTACPCRKRRACRQLHSLAPFLARGGARELALSALSPLPPHPYSFNALKAAWAAWRVRCRHLGQPPQAGDAAVASGAAGRDEAIAGRAGHGARAKTFAAWLAENAPRSLLERGVLDVAGGRGDVAFELATVRGFPVTTIDPRPPAPRSHQRRRWRTPGARRPGYVQARFDAAFVADAANAALLEGCGLVIGFHPDQATDGVIDFAVASGKAVVLVPCCVFAREFPERRRENGGDVTSFEDLVEYCTERLRGSRTEFLPYNGRNLALVRW
jgi:hypothetical protein